jgi:hypothetical protein
MVAITAPGARRGGIATCDLVTLASRDASGAASLGVTRGACAGRAASGAGLARTT